MLISLSFGKEVARIVLALRHQLLLSYHLIAIRAGADVQNVSPLRNPVMLIEGTYHPQLLRIIATDGSHVVDRRQAITVNVLELVLVPWTTAERSV
jgi:hypothetical protein